MHNRVGFNKLSRKTSHRVAMTRNMVTSLFRYERINTTKAKALEIRKTAEKMITRAKVDSVHNRRIVNKDIKDAEVLNKLFTEIGPANKNRPGGYTRILKTGFRKGDAAEMVILELVFDEVESGKKSSKKKAKPAKAETKKVEPEKADAKEEVTEEAKPEAEDKKEAVEAEEVSADAVVEDSTEESEEPSEEKNDVEE